MSLEDLYKKFQNEIITYGSSSESTSSLDCSFKENAFTEIVLTELSNDGILESSNPQFIEFPKGNGMAKCNGFDIPEDDSKIDIIITDYYSNDNIQKINQQDIEKKLLQAYRFIETAFKDDGANIFDYSTEQYSAMKSIFDKKNECDHVNIYLITNALNVSRKIEFTKSIEGKQVTFEIYDLERYKRFREGGTRLDPIQVNLSEYGITGIPCVGYQSDDGFTTAVMIVPGNLLFELYERYRSRLLELNVRSYLQARGKVNKGILKTILTEPSKFLTYNNGITVVAESVEFNDSKTLIKGFTGLQIVNGGQTTASIHRAHKENKAPLDKIAVQAKLTIVPVELFENVVPLISEYSNTQNKVNSVDLGANHPFHVGIERVAKVTWQTGQTSKWFYERARSSYETERSKNSTKLQLRNFDIEYPRSNVMTKEDLARYSNLWALLPQIVSRGGQKNFTKFMDSIGGNFKKDWEPSQDEYKELIGLAIFCRTISKTASSMQIPGYRVNIVNYTTSLIIHKTAKRIDRKKIWEVQSVSDAMRELITDWLQKMCSLLIEIADKDFPGENTGEVFKKDKCWEVLLSKTQNWALPSNVASELLTFSDTGLSVEVENDIARCLQLSAENWFSIAKWGAESGMLETWQKGIASTLSSYANDGWTKKPSEKQAKHGAAIIKIYQDYQIK